MLATTLVRRSRASIAVGLAVAVLLGTPALTAPAQAKRINSEGLLGSLTVAAERRSGYSSASFGGWADSARKGCDAVNDEVLAVQARGKTPKKCRLGDLRWTDPFSRKKVKRAKKMTVIRLVPLEEAWSSGAAAWSDRTRRAFTNDLQHDATLMAVAKKSDRRRDDREPQSWLPTERKRCDYLTAWVSVKYRWGLTVDAAERRALSSGLLECSWPDVDAPARALTGPRPAPAPAPAPAPEPAPNDARYETCAEMHGAGLGPYLRGRDPEYAWYRDDDGDGTACGQTEDIAITPGTDWRSTRLIAHARPVIQAVMTAPPRYDPTQGSVRGSLHVRVFRGSTELWYGISGARHYLPGDRQTAAVQIPVGVLTQDQTYRVQIWTGAADTAEPVPANAIETDFTLDTTPPSAPTVTGDWSFTAKSTSADVVAYQYGVNTDATPNRIGVRPGEAAGFNAGSGSGPGWVTVRAEDRVGNLSSATRRSYR